MPTEKEVYDSHAEQYELLILREDYQNNIPKEINKIKSVDGLDIVELGAGTGRLTRFLAGKARSLAACDASHHMLMQAKAVLSDNASNNPVISVADMRFTPFSSHSADMVIGGWSFCYLAVWGGDAWQREIDKGLAEAKRLLRPGGVMIVLENFGTGYESPNPPPHLNGYFDYLKEKGFSSTWSRTDYKFASFEEALELSGFFFGKDYARKVRDNHWITLPECTGLLWLIM
ncbi:MAG: methyltransferase domain-containing protein [Pelolinea sp.]|nr:methyltransferase domain-containing protein [Pelolinea sp.]